MRLASILLTFAMAGPAMAQPYLAAQARDAQTQADLQALRYREVQITNELAALQARLQAEQAVSNLQAARASPTLTYAPRRPDAPPLVIDLSQMASIPDATLAQSNARVRAAANNRR